MLMNPCPIVIALVVNEERISMKRDFCVVVEKDEDGFFVGDVPQLRACYAQGKTMKKAGFKPTRQGRNHMRLRHKDGRVITIPIHPGKTPGHLRNSVS